MQGARVQTTQLGRTGLTVSRIGLGGHEYRWLHDGNIKDSRHVRFNPVRTRVVAAALEAGVTCFDSTYTEEAQSLGHVLRDLGKLNDVVINGMIIDPVRRSLEMSSKQRADFVAGELDTRLELLGREFDIFMLCAIDHAYSLERVLEMIDIYERHRAGGKFRFLGVSCHDHALLAEFLGHNPAVDVVMFPYNYAIAVNATGRLEALTGLLDIADKLGVGMVGMKPLCWSHYGIPFTATLAGPLSVQELVGQSFAWQAQQARPHTSVVGVETVEELETILSGVRSGVWNEQTFAGYAEKSRDYETLLRNGHRHSPEIQQRILGAVRWHLKGTHGVVLDTAAGIEECLAALAGLPA